jgi:hypothetical protein
MPGILAGKLAGKGVAVAGATLADIRTADTLIPAFRPDFVRADDVSAHVFPCTPI